MGVRLRQLLTGAGRRFAMLASATPQLTCCGGAVTRFRPPGPRVPGWRPAEALYDSRNGDYWPDQAARVARRERFGARTGSRPAGPRVERHVLQLPYTTEALL